MAQTANFGLEKPSTDKNVDEEFYQLQETLDLLDSILAALQTAVNGKSAVGHTHAISDVVNLAAELAAKMPASQTFKLDDLTDVSGADGAPNNYVLVKSALGWLPSSALAALGPHGHLISEITGLVDALAGKADGTATADALALRVRVDAGQAFSAAQQGRARANIGGGVLAGFRNKIINGDFTVAQRSLPVAVAANSSTYTLDRWLVNTVAGITASANRVALSAGHALGRFFGQFAFAGTGVSGSNVRQRIEGVETLAGEKATLTFAIADTVATAGVVQVRQVFGTGGSPSAPVAVNYPITIGNTLAKQAVAVDIPSIAGKTLGTNGDDYLEISFIPTVANAHTMSLGRVSLVAGDATAEDDPFSPRHPQQELALCQRYYMFMGALGTPCGGTAGAGQIVGTVMFNFPVRMRATPAISVTASAGINLFGFLSLPTVFGVHSYITVSAAGYGYVVFTHNWADAEL